MIKNNQLQSSLFALAALFSATSLTATEQPQNGTPATSEIPAAVQQIDNIAVTEAASLSNEANKPSAVATFAKAALSSPWLWAAVTAAVYQLVLIGVRQKWNEDSGNALLFVPGGFIAYSALNFLPQAATDWVQDNRTFTEIGVVGIVGWVVITLALRLIFWGASALYCFIMSKKEEPAKEEAQTA